MRLKACCDLGSHRPRGTCTHWRYCMHEPIEHDHHASSRWLLHVLNLSLYTKSNLRAWTNQGLTQVHSGIAESAFEPRHGGAVLNAEKSKSVMSRTLGISVATIFPLLCAVARAVPVSRLGRPSFGRLSIWALPLLEICTNVTLLRCACASSL